MGRGQLGDDRLIGVCVCNGTQSAVRKCMVALLGALMMAPVPDRPSYSADGIVERGSLGEQSEGAASVASPSGNVQRVTITINKSRTFIKSGTEGREFWAASDKPDVNDETANNWLRKIQNLRPVKFLDKLPEGAEKVVRVEYGSKNDTLGYMEVHRYMGEGDKDEFVVTSDYLRMPATVAATIAEQVADDLSSLYPAAE